MILPIAKGTLARGLLRRLHRFLYLFTSEFADERNRYVLLRRVDQKVEVVYFVALFPAHKVHGSLILFYKEKLFVGG